MTLRIPVLGLERRFVGEEAVVSQLLAEICAEPKAILGERVERFERWIERTVNVAHAVAVSSGTGALLVALRAAGVGPGKRVAVPAFGHIAPAAAVAWLGAEPVFVDVRDDDLTLDPEAFARVASRVDVVLPVHQFTSLARMDALREIAGRAGVLVLEDSAVALGAGWGDRAAGTAGAMGVFSFHPVKVFGTIGDAGVVVTSDDSLADVLRQLRNHGQGKVRFHYERIGFNSRMDEVIAGHLLSRTERLSALIDRRLALLEAYRRGLEDVPGIRLPAFRAERRLAYAMTIRTSDRDRLRSALSAAGIETLIQYPRPIPRSPAFASHPQHAAEFPVAERVGAEILTLPLFPELRDSEVDEVIAVLRSACSRAT